MFHSCLQTKPDEHLLLQMSLSFPVKDINIQYYINY